MAPMPALRTTTELYPPKASDEVAALTNRIVVCWPDEFDPAAQRKAAPELSRPLNVKERAALENRRSVLDHWVKPGSPNRLKLAISEMFNGFGSADRSEEDQDLLNANYAYACKERPVWAVERACLRFRRGEVRAEEIGEKSLSTTWKPSSAQLNMVAKAIEESTVIEHVRVGEILRATVFLNAPESAKARIDAVVDATARHLRARQAERDFEQVEHQLRQEADSDRRQKEALKRCDESYRRAGLEPPKWQPGQIPVSLEMKMQFGWTIQQIEGNPVLVSPAKMKERSA